MARNTLRDMLVDYYFPRQGIIEYSMTPGQQAGQNRLARLGGGPAEANTDGAITPPSLRFESYEAPQQTPSGGGGEGGGLTLPDIIQQYFPNADFSSGGAGLGGGGGGQGGMGRGPGSHAPNVASQGFGNDVMAALDALSGNIGPLGMIDTLGGLAFADNFDEMPSMLGALLDALGLGDSSDPGSRVDGSVEAGAIADIGRQAGLVGAYNNPVGPIGVTPGLPNPNPVAVGVTPASSYGSGGGGGSGPSGGGGTHGHGNHGAHGGAGARGNRR